MTRKMPGSSNSSTPNDHAPGASSLPPQSSHEPVDILILGAGWTSHFLVPQLRASKITYAATTRSGHDDTIPFTFDPTSRDPADYKTLPLAKTVLITFPLKGSHQSTQLVTTYRSTHPAPTTSATNFIQLGSIGIYQSPGWNDYKSPYNTLSERAIAEDELLGLDPDHTCVLDLAGLYGGERQLRHWLPRVATCKEDVAAKGAVSMIHGNDVSRAIISAHWSLLGASEQHDDGAIHTRTRPVTTDGNSLPHTAAGQRWPVTDLYSYDWWDLFMQFGRYAREHAPPPVTGTSSASTATKSAQNTTSTTTTTTTTNNLQYEKWVLELMEEKDVRSLPRDSKDLGKLVDGRAFWSVVGSWPLEGRADRVA